MSEVQEALREVRSLLLDLYDYYGSSSVATSYTMKVIARLERASDSLGKMYRPTQVQREWLAECLRLLALPDEQAGDRISVGTARQRASREVDYWPTIEDAEFLHEWLRG